VSSAEDLGGRAYAELHAVQRPPGTAAGSPPARSARPKTVVVGRHQVRGGLLDFRKYFSDEATDQQRALRAARQAAAYLTRVVLQQKS
jgi:hypothetical protein